MVTGLTLYHWTVLAVDAFCVASIVYSIRAIREARRTTRRLQRRLKAMTDDNVEDDGRENDDYDGDDDEDVSFTFTFKSAAEYEYMRALMATGAAMVGFRDHMEDDPAGAVHQAAQANRMMHDAMRRIGPDDALDVMTRFVNEGEIAYEGNLQWSMRTEIRTRVVDGVVKPGEPEPKAGSDDGGWTEIRLGGSGKGQGPDDKGDKPVPTWVPRAPKVKS